MTGNIDITLRNKIGKGTGGNSKSVGNRRTQIRNSSNKNKLGNNNIKEKRIAIDNAEIAAKFAPAIAVIAVASKVANKGVDLYAKYQIGKTGQTVHYTNIKAAKDMIFSLGKNYVSGYIQNELFTKKAVERQNSTLEYDRQIYNINNYGNKYKTR